MEHDDFLEVRVFHQRDGTVWRLDYLSWSLLKVENCSSVWDGWKGNLALRWGRMGWLQGPISFYESVKQDHLCWRQSLKVQCVEDSDHLFCLLAGYRWGNVLKFECEGLRLRRGAFPDTKDMSSTKETRKRSQFTSLVDPTPNEEDPSLVEEKAPVFPFSSVLFNINWIFISVVTASISIVTALLQLHGFFKRILRECADWARTTNPWVNTHYFIC